MTATNGDAPPTTPAPVALSLEPVVSGRHGELADALLVRFVCGLCKAEADAVLVDVHYPLKAMAAHHRQAHAERVATLPARIQRPGVDF